jgi:hypothetical protein
MKKFFNKYLLNYAAYITACLFSTMSDQQLNDIGLSRHNLVGQLKQRFMQ